MLRLDGCCKHCRAHRVIQIILVRVADLAAILAGKEIQPTCIVQRKHMIGVTGEFADEQYLQSVVGARCIQPFPHAALLPDFIDVLTERSMKTQGFLTW